MFTQPNENYNSYLEKLKIEMSMFLNLAEKAGISNRGRLPLKARKSSILLRSLLKEFRNISINKEKELKEIFNKTNEKIRK